MRRNLFAAALVLAATAAVIAAARHRDAPASPRLWRDGKMLIAIVPEETAIELAGSEPSALTVFPQSRRVADFFEEISFGAPHLDLSSPTIGKAGALFDTLARSRIGVEVLAQSSQDELFPATHDPFKPVEQTSLSGHLPERILVVYAREPSDLTHLPEWGNRPAVLIVGVPSNGKTPVRVIAHRTVGSILSNSMTRRPGIVTPYDIAATVLDHFHVQRPSNFIGRPLRALPGEPDVNRISRLGARLERDSSFAQSLTAYTVIIGLGLGWLLALGLAVIGRRGWALRLTTGASFATTGFIAGLFVPSARGDFRALTVFAGLIAGVVITPRDRTKFIGGIFVVAGATMAILAVAAALHPGGEPALSIWGNPLTSWRFFGLQNYGAEIVAGAVVGAAALGAGATVLAAAGIAGLLIVGAPAVGANFVGVLTLAFGATFAVLASRAKALKPWHLLAAAVIAAGAFALALTADAHSASSHGGEAARAISRGGVSAAWRLARHRLELNVQAIRAFPGGIAWALLFVYGFVGMSIWAFGKRNTHPLPIRIAIAAGSAAAFAALVLEDSGFKASAVMGFPALMLFALVVVAPRGGVVLGE